MRTETIRTYIKAIYSLEKKYKNVRGIELAEYLNISRATVCNTLKKLEEMKYIEFCEDRSVFLTSKGNDEAREAIKRCDYLSDKLIALGVKLKTALDDAHKIECCISNETYRALKKHFSKLT
ncbi:MAG: metal-dependent transcriptional regulator [Ruminiclostridium sp.]|nr:metal-dependent transcriptional regulator [Ruminiclostridium sp.]